jgi:hypothetical protein
MGSAPVAVLLLLFLREAQETLFFQGTTAEALRPLAFGLAGVYFVRFPFRLALARWMAQASHGEEPSLLRALGFAVVHLPTALFYGALSTLGWMLGSIAVVPILGTIRGSLALHRFAATELGAWAALREAGRIPAGRIGLRLIGTAGVLYLCAFLVVWTSPGAALGLAEWLLRAKVAALREVLDPLSPPWLAVALVLPLAGVELLWSVAFGLLSSEWSRLCGASDLLASLHELERKAASGEGFD